MAQWVKQYPHNLDHARTHEKSKKRIPRIYSPRSLTWKWVGKLEKLKKAYGSARLKFSVWQQK